MVNVGVVGVAGVKWNFGARDERKIFVLHHVYEARNCKQNVGQTSFAQWRYQSR